MMRFLWKFLSFLVTRYRCKSIMDVQANEARLENVVIKLRTSQIGSVEFLLTRSNKRKFVVPRIHPNAVKISAIVRKTKRRCMDVWNSEIWKYVSNRAMPLRNDNVALERVIAACASMSPVMFLNPTLQSVMDAVFIVKQLRVYCYKYRKNDEHLSMLS